jgi:lipoprotein Spr
MKRLFCAFAILASFFAQTLQAQALPERDSIDYTLLSEKLGFSIDATDSANLDLYRAAADWLGVEYKWGGKSRSNGVDCSGFTSRVYEQVYDFSVPFSSKHLSERVPEEVKTVDNLRPGDMVFFSTNRRRDRINHVGVYLRDGLFVHASSAKGKVTISSLITGFYKKAWRMGGRFK